MILVTGAAGKTGQAIIQTLANRGADVRAFVYRSDYIEPVKVVGAREGFVGDLQDEVALTQAARGCHAIYHICPNMHPDEIAIGQRVTAAAKQAGIQRLVYHSVLHPQVEAMPHHWHKLRVEEMLFESGLDFTILQPAAYMQNILGGWQAIVSQGVYRVPYPVETRLSIVDLDDVADVAARVLTEPGHTGALYELAGPDNPSQSEVALLLSDLLGYPVKAEQISIDAWTEGAKKAGLGGYQIETLVKMFRYYEQYHFEGNANVLGWLLGRPPTTLRTFLETYISTER
ncbi:MAG TPA: NmrA family NAD(P)-binding protein [Anaerolineae bacterium]|nr:NmrA family NAD(P)-binding protein [Anaerolineae bacterium]MCB9105718.1 NmrA family NAD(P)-binding protein [Anaerolineales bacterium]HRV93127.1 NmrA family NAD(P)-binding protein [Anaerolineae bacterium]